MAKLPSNPAVNRDFRPKMRKLKYVVVAAEIICRAWREGYPAGKTFYNGQKSGISKLASNQVRIFIGIPRRAKSLKR